MVHSLLHSTAQLFYGHPWLATLMIFLGTTSEGVPLLGGLLLGLTSMAAGSALAITGHLSLWALGLAAFGGSVVGDASAYHLGWYYHAHIWAWPPFQRFNRRHPRTLQRAEALFRRWGFWTVGIGRFVFGLRSYVAILAGIYRMPPGPFYLSNLISSFVWAAAHVLLVLLAMQAIHF